MRHFVRVMTVVILRSFSSIALASSVKGIAAVAADSRCTFRLATKSDISSISFCNIQTLPENYSDSYFENHIARWPNLSLLAENENKKLVGYVLGKIEDDSTDFKAVKPWVVTYKPPVFHGHVTSIAVQHNHRGKGVAKELMKLLHSQLVNEHDINSVTLHCRESNLAAINMYVKTFQYDFVEELDGYYDDGERYCHCNMMN